MSVVNPAPSTFRTIFFTLMAYTAVVWAWTMALMILMPWEDATGWEPHYRVVALCQEKGEKDGCTVKFGELAKAREEGRIVALTGMADFGDTSDKEAWHNWKKGSGKAWDYEVNWSSWDFEEGVRYRLDGDNPILLQHRLVGVKMLHYALVLGLITLIGGWLLKRRAKKA